MCIREYLTCSVNIFNYLAVVIKDMGFLTPIPPFVYQDYKTNVFTACSLSDWDQLASGLFRFGLDPLLLDDEDDTAASMS